MKRKIAAIFAADVAGYSRLVAEDEEETLRRLAAYRAVVARQLGEASTGWNAVAVGTAGHPGLGLKASSEQNVIDDALGNCVKHDTDCHVIAIGPFTVGPN